MDAPTRIVALIFASTALARAERLYVCDDQLHGFVPASTPKTAAYVTAFGPVGNASGWVTAEGLHFPPAAWWFVIQNGTSTYIVYDGQGNPVDSGSITAGEC